MRANGFGYKTKSYEWMTHKSFHEVTRAECRDWMKVNIEGKKRKRKRLHFYTTQGAFVLPAQSGWRVEFVFMGWTHEKTSL